MDTPRGLGCRFIERMGAESVIQDPFTRPKETGIEDRSSARGGYMAQNRGFFKLPAVFGWETTSARPKKGQSPSAFVQFDRVRL
jgi:hypothetical protein